MTTSDWRPHRPTGTPLIGLALGLTAALIWGTLPVMLKIVVRWLDVFTITWARFLVAGMLLLPFALGPRGLRSLPGLTRLSWAMLAASVVGLTGNYLTFMGGLRFVSPSTAQVVVQLSPMFMLLCGLLVFGERFGRRQWFGLAILLTGQALFFQPRLGVLLADVDREGFGVLLLVLAALLWGIYMVTQKQLLTDLKPEAILVVIYLVGAAFMLPWVDLPSLLRLSLPAAALLLAAGVLTMVSYLAFAVALHHAEASRVSVMFSLTPLVAVGEVALLARWRPGLMAPDELPFVSMAGAAAVVVGSALVALRRAAPMAVDHGRLCRPRGLHL